MGLQFFLQKFAKKYIFEKSIKNLNFQKNGIYIRDLLTYSHHVKFQVPIFIFSVFMAQYVYDVMTPLF